MTLLVLSQFVIGQRQLMHGFDLYIEYLKEIEASLSGLVGDEKGVFGVGAREIVIA